MRIDIATLFPEMCESVLSESILGRARKAGYITVCCHQIRDYSQDKRRRVDDYGYGGGKGMVMQADPLYQCWEAICQMAATDEVVGTANTAEPAETVEVAGSAEGLGIVEAAGSADVAEVAGAVELGEYAPVVKVIGAVKFAETDDVVETADIAIPAEAVGETEVTESAETTEATEALDPANPVSGEMAGQSAYARPYTIYMSPQGTVLTQQKCMELSRYPHLIVLCGHYEGVDERVLEEVVDEEISIGDYVLTGGELPALVMVDAIARMCDGVLSSSECYEEESHFGGLLEYPQYSRPEEWHGKMVPEVLLSGHHGNVARWRQKQRLYRTMQKRPDLFSRYAPDKQDKKLLAELAQEAERLSQEPKSEGEQ